MALSKKIHSTKPMHCSLSTDLFSLRVFCSVYKASRSSMNSNGAGQHKSFTHIKHVTLHFLDRRGAASRCHNRSCVLPYRSPLRYSVNITWVPIVIIHCVDFFSFLFVFFFCGNLYWKCFKMFSVVFASICNAIFCLLSSFFTRNHIKEHSAGQLYSVGQLDDNSLIRSSGMSTCSLQFSYLSPSEEKYF